MSVYEHLWKMVQQSSFSSANGKIAEYLLVNYYEMTFVKKKMRIIFVFLFGWEITSPAGPFAEACPGPRHG